MKVSVRFLTMAIAALAIVFAASTATAQIIGPGPFPTCASGNLTINNHSLLPVILCIKTLPCIPVAASSTVNQALPPGTPIPGVYGVANVTYPWTPNPAAPFYLIPSLSMNPTGRCFDVQFDESTCTIDIFQVLGPPCTNP